MMIVRTCVWRLRRLMSDLLLWRGNSVSAAAVELAPTRCFGELADGEQLALEGFIADGRPSDAECAA